MQHMWINLAFYPSGVGKLSTGLWLGLRLAVFTCIRWQVTLCDPVWQVTSRSSDIELHEDLYSS